SEAGTGSKRSLLISGGCDYRCAADIDSRPQRCWIATLVAGRHDVGISRRGRVAEGREGSGIRFADERWRRAEDYGRTAGSGAICVAAEPEGDWVCDGG